MKALEKYEAKKGLENEETDPAIKLARSKKFLKKDSKEDDSYEASEVDAQSDARLKSLLKKLG